jgi:hypothetical protein
MAWGWRRDKGVCIKHLLFASSSLINIPLASFSKSRGGTISMTLALALLKSNNINHMERPVLTSLKTTHALFRSLPFYLNRALSITMLALLDQKNLALLVWS